MVRRRVQSVRRIRYQRHQLYGSLVDLLQVHALALLGRPGMASALPDEKNV
jgi:hypothetical protein